MTKYIVLILLSNCLWAQTLLKCLGSEEAAYAKSKYTGPMYKLNQTIIEEISSLSDLKITSSAYERICGKNSKTPSLRLLKDLLSSDVTIFENERSNSLASINFDHLKNNAGHILINYIGYLQSMTEDPKCLEKNIPELAKLYKKYQYLEEEVENQKLVGSKDELERIFKGLGRIDQILNKCKSFKKYSDIKSNK